MFYIRHVINTICAVHLLSSTISANTIDKPQKLLIVSYDAFRPDYFNRDLTPYMNKLRHRGTVAEYLQTVFPTLTFVNHHSIATGLYPGSHGVLSNSLYDHRLNRELTDKSDLFQYNPDIRPIWTLNELAGGHSGCMMWPGTEVIYSNRSCTFTVPNNDSMPWNDRVDQMISWFTHPDTPANLVLFYITEPDLTAHIYSTKSYRMKETIARLDNVTAYMHRQLRLANFTEHLNIIHLSDHGMADVASPRYIDLTQWLTNGTYAIYQSSPVLQIVPVDNDSMADIVQRLECAAAEIGHFHVYTNETIPERWHLQNEQRFGPIIVVADLNYGFQDQNVNAEKFLRLYDVPIDPSTEYGLHGYDNSEPTMRAMFFANGPMIRRNNLIGPLANVDLYNLFCRILSLDPDQNNGTMGNVEIILADEVISWTSTILTVVISILAIGTVVGAVILYFKLRKKNVFGKLKKTNTTALNEIVPGTQ